MSKKEGNNSIKKLSTSKILILLVLILAIVITCFQTYANSDYKADKDEKNAEEKAEKIESELDGVAKKIKVNFTYPKFVEELNENSTVTVSLKLPKSDKYEYHYFPYQTDDKDKKVKSGNFKVEKSLTMVTSYDSSDSEADISLGSIYVMPRGSKLKDGMFNIDKKQDVSVAGGVIDLSTGYKNYSSDYLTKLIELTAQKNDKDYEKSKKYKKDKIYSFDTIVQTDYWHKTSEYRLNKSSNDNIYAQKFNGGESESESNYPDDKVPAKIIGKEAYFIDEKSGEKIYLIRSRGFYYDIEWPDYVSESDKFNSSVSSATENAETRFGEDKSKLIESKGFTLNIGQKRKIYGELDKIEGNENYDFIPDSHYYRLK